MLYAQPLARVLTLTTADVIDLDGRTELRLGPDPLELPEPFATLIRALPHKRRDSTADQLPNPTAAARAAATTSGHWANYPADRRS